MKYCKVSLIIFSLVFLISVSEGYPSDEKEEIRGYLSKINTVLIEVQIMARNLSQKFLMPEGAVRQMSGYIKTIESLRPPPFFIREHRMILLSFKKMQSGFYLLSKGDRQASLPLIKNAAALLKLAANELVEYARREGLVKDKREIENSGPEGK